MSAVALTVLGLALLPAAAVGTALLLSGDPCDVPLAEGAIAEGTGFGTVKRAFPPKLACGYGGDRAVGPVSGSVWLSIGLGVAWLLIAAARGVSRADTRLGVGLAVLLLSGLAGYAGAAPLAIALAGAAGIVLACLLARASRNARAACLALLGGILCGVVAFATGAGSWIAWLGVPLLTLLLRPKPQG